MKRQYKAYNVITQICIFAESRTLSMKEIITDEDVKNHVNNNEAFPMCIERYGCPYRETYNGIGGRVYVTNDGYVVVSTSLYLGYYRMTREELDKIFQLSDDKSGRGRYGFFETEKEMELLYVDGEVNPKLLEELK